jgi:hypothetical protein
MSNAIDAKDFLSGNVPEDTQRGTIAPKPSGPKSRYANGSRPTYYKVEYGKAILPHLVKMLEKKTDIEFAPTHGEKLNTVYQRVQQSFTYAVDMLDVGGQLDALRAKVVLRKTPRSVVLCFKENAMNYGRQQSVLREALVRHDAFAVRDVVTVEWRPLVNELMENSDKVELRINDGVFLAPEDQETVKALVESAGMLGDPMKVVTLDSYNLHIRREKTGA